jgi:Protein of unknown function (DUF1353)
MAGFNNTVFLAVADSGTAFRVLNERLVYTGSQGDSWAIPHGFTTDFATIPAAVSWAVPKLGAYTLAAIVHDMLCEGLNRYHRNREEIDRLAQREVPYPLGAWADAPTANAVDTDAIFRKIARDYGTDPVTATLLWVGVRWGALFNPARRQGWLSTARQVVGLSLLFAPVLVPATVLAIVGGAVLGVIKGLFRLAR